MSDPARDLIVPAPFWRRLAALIYDSLLVVGLCLSGTLIAVLVAHLFGAERPSQHALSAWLLLIGYGFFGWSWTRSGRTPGMLAWKLQLRRTDGSAVRWPVALLRYAAALLSWGGLVIGAIGLAMMRHVPLSLALMCCGVLSVGWSLLDPRRRALHDLVAGTEMVLLPTLESSAIGAG